MSKFLNNRHHLFTKRDNTIIKNLLNISVLLLMSKSLYLSFTWYIPYFIIYLFLIFSLWLLIISSQNKMYKKDISLCILFIILQIYIIVFGTSHKVSVIIAMNVSSFCTCILILLSYDVKVELMHFLSKALGVTLLISITAWILFLLGFSWPHYISQDSTQEFYIHDNYYFFVKSAKAQSIEILPRFCSFFLEPGHLASTCCFFIFINKFNIRQWYVLLMILAVILSFSLAGYVLLIISLISYLQLYGKHFKRNLIVCLSILIGIWMFFQSFNDGNNVVNERIISRLIFEDGEMVGNNRFSMLFEKKFQKLIKTEDVYFGAQRHLSKIDYKYNWMDGSAGWKRCIAMYGIIGTFLILIFYLSYLLSIWSYSGFLFFIIFFIANCIRDYPLREYWLYTYLLAIPILQRQYKDFKTKNIN